MKRLLPVIVKTAICAMLLGASLLFTGCERAADMELFALNTHIRLDACGHHSKAALDDCAAEIERLEDLLSINRSNSDVHRINGGNGAPTTVDAETAALLSKAKRLSALTDGAFDPTVYPLVRLWGFGNTPAVPNDTAIEAQLPLVNADNLHIDGLTVAMPVGAGIDLGGIAKGYVSDRLAELLRARGIESALLTLGGNVHALGSRRDGESWRIGVRDPLDESAVIGIVEACDTAVITSGSYQRYFEQDGVRYHHILDPKTGWPAESGLLSVTVISESGAEADALSTALFVMGAEDAIAFWRAQGDFGFILVEIDGAILYSENAPFTPLDGYASEMIALNERG